MRGRIRSLVLTCVCLALTSCAPSQFGVMNGLDDPFTETSWYYDSIIFEISPIGTTCAPDPAALEIFRARLDQNRLCPADRVTFVVRSPVVSVVPPVWSCPALSIFEASQRKLWDKDEDDRDLVAFVSYVTGLYHDFDGVKSLGGLQYGPTSFTIFKNGAGEREAGVLLHEFGHLIGMVKDPTRDNHDDAHERHCANKRCVMFWTTPGPLADFDYYCKRDLRRRISAR